MNYTIAFFILAAISLNACKKPITYCGVEDPINEIGWLKDEVKDNPPNLRVYKQTYNSIEGFYLYDCVDTGCNNTTAVYKTCDNTLLYTASGGIVPPTFPNDFLLNSTYREQIYP